jgi:hypothetical protein
MKHAFHFTQHTRNPLSVPVKAKIPKLGWPEGLHNRKIKCIIRVNLHEVNFRHIQATQKYVNQKHKNNMQNKNCSNFKV